MARERLRKLAQRLNKSVDELTNVLDALGERRYHNPDDMLPDALVLQIEAHLKRRPAAPAFGHAPQDIRKAATRPSPVPARDPGERPVPLPALPREIPDDPTLNATLQEYLTAGESLESLRAKLPAGKSTRGSSKGEQPAPLSVEETLRTALGGEIRQRRLAQEALEAARQLWEVERRDFAARERALHDVIERSAADHALQLEQVRASQQPLEMALSHAQHERLQAIDTLNQALERLELLESQLSEERSARRALQASLDALEPRVGAIERSETPLDDLETPDPDPEVHKLEPRQLSSAPKPLFQVSSSATPTRASSRQEIASRFLQACQARGYARINVVGGSPAYHQELEQLLGGTLELRGIDGTGGMDTRRARQHVEGADITIVWGATQLKHRVSRCYTDLRDDRIISVTHRGLEGMLRAVLDVIENSQRFNQSA